MATAWDTASYPLDGATSFNFGDKNRVDRLADGTVRNRVVTSVKPVVLPVALSPMDEATSAAFQSGVLFSPGTEYAITHNGTTYTGYIVTRSARMKVTGGVLHWWTFDFEAVAS